MEHAYLVKESMATPWNIIHQTILFPIYISILCFSNTISFCTLNLKYPFLGRIVKYITICLSGTQFFLSGWIFYIYAVDCSKMLHIKQSFITVCSAKKTNLENLYDYREIYRATRGQDMTDPEERAGDTQTNFGSK